jgi:UDP:flavonoid glycosyltransferase YjiC (YdhE family)
MKNIVETYTDAWWTRGNIDASITQMVADAEAKAEAKRLAEETAAAEAAAEVADSQEGEAKEDENEETKQ